MSSYPAPPLDPPPFDMASRGIAKAVLDVLGHIPASKRTSANQPAQASHALAHEAGRHAALTAGSLALPPGPLGWLTLLPELVAIWRIQAQMVSDIAACYDKQAELGREQMLWCLFRHSTAQAFRGIAVRHGPKLLFRHLSSTALQHLSRKIGLKLTQRSLGHGVARWLPLVGAAGIATFAYRDTQKVAHNAIALFSGQVDFDAAAERQPDLPASSYEVKTTAQHPGSGLHSSLQRGLVSAARKLSHTARRNWPGNQDGQQSNHD